MSNATDVPAAAAVALAASVTNFWTKVDQSGGPDACWPWTGHVDLHGYGITTWQGRNRRTHELALAFSVGAVKPEGLDTCHSCHERACCNPSHLRWDTRRGNMRDMVDAGRQAVGVDHGQAKLTPNKVIEARQLYTEGHSQASLGRRFGVSSATIGACVYGATWTHVGGPISTRPKRAPRKAQIQT